MSQGNRETGEKDTSAFIQRMKILVDRAGNANRLADLTGISRRAIGTYLSGESDPSRERLVRLAKAAGVGVTWLATGEGPMTVHAPPERDLCDIRVYDLQASAGAGTAVDAERNEKMRVPTPWLQTIGARPEEVAALTAAGDSMEPTIRGGDLLLVDLRGPQGVLDGVYVIRIGEDLLVKRLQRLPQGQVQALSDNPKYDAFVFDPVRDNVRVVGRVFWLARALHR